MVRWDAGFMLSNGRPLLDLVRKTRIEPSRLPAERRLLSAASDVSAVILCHRLSTGARSPFFCRLRQRDPPTEPGSGALSVSPAVSAKVSKSYPHGRDLGHA